MNDINGMLFCRIQYLRHIRDYFGLVYKIDVHPTGSEDTSAEEGALRFGGDKVTLTCTGVGFRNLSRVVL